MLLEALRAEICRLNQDLPRYNLVTWTSGNVSGLDREAGLMVIKPSGVQFADLTPESMVLLDLKGQVVEGRLKPSSDTHAHLYIYNHMPQVTGIVHTHSNFATAFAALGKPIPAVLTAICDEFGGAIPCGRYARIGNDEIGREVVRTVEASPSPAVLLQNHGVFTFGRTPEESVKAAVMVEDVARTVFYALQLGPVLGPPIEIPPEEVARARQRYVTEYGQS